MNALRQTLRKNRTRLITLAILLGLFLTATQSMSTQDWTITLLRGLAVSAVVFLVASGFSIIFGLMDVLNLAHGMLFMVGAYVGWTFYARPDTVVDLITPLTFLAAGFVLMPVWNLVLGRLKLPSGIARVWPWIGLVVAVVILLLTVSRYPIGIWDVAVTNQSPVTFGLQLELGTLKMPEPVRPEGGILVIGLAGALLGSALAAASLAGFSHARHGGGSIGRMPSGAIITAVVLLVIGLGVYAINDPLTAGLFDLSTTLRFPIALVVATLTGAGLGALMESSLIRPLYSRPIYQLMLTLALGVIGREVVIAVWGRNQIAMTPPALFNGSGKGCPANNLGDWLTHQCATMNFMGGRLRTYNEIFLILVGVAVLVIVGLLLQRTRLGMIIRAGVQDSEMVEALGINVRRVFTLVFALGVSLAALGGALAGPAFGVSDDMGETLLLKALIALAIGGLTSFPGAAAGSLLVGVMEQFIVKYGQIGIPLPFVNLVFKPTPPIVPASTVLMMVIILLVLPQGLFGSKE